MQAQSVLTDTRSVDGRCSRWPREVGGLETESEVPLSSEVVHTWRGGRGARRPVRTCLTPCGLTREVSRRNGRIQRAKMHCDPSYRTGSGPHSGGTPLRTETESTRGATRGSRGRAAPQEASTRSTLCHSKDCTQNTERGREQPRWQGCSPLSDSQQATNFILFLYVHRGKSSSTGGGAIKGKREGKGGLLSSARLGKNGGFLRFWGRLGPRAECHGGRIEGGVCRCGTGETWGE